MGGCLEQTMDGSRAVCDWFAQPSRPNREHAYCFEGVPLRASVCIRTTRKVIALGRFRTRRVSGCNQSERSASRIFGCSCESSGESVHRRECASGFSDVCRHGNARRSEMESLSDGVRETETAVANGYSGQNVGRHRTLLRSENVRLRPTFGGGATTPGRGGRRWGQHRGGPTLTPPLPLRAVRPEPSPYRFARCARIASATAMASPSGASDFLSGRAMKR